jgi:DNA-binding NtrC family response regulator
MDVLIADDEELIVVPLKDDLEAAGHKVRTVSDGRQALELVREIGFDCLITDINMPGMTGIELLRAAKDHQASLDVLVITGYGTVESAVEAMKLGAYDYILKPFLNEEVVLLLEKISDLHRLRDENAALRAELQDVHGFPNIIGKSRKMQDVFQLVKMVGRADSGVLIEGESGTGKERIAQAIHYSSHRKDKAFVPLSCAALPETLLEDELFGHERGAFTDARKRKIGRFERAHQGSIFFDDIDDMSLPIQVKLLRVLQERSFERLGGEETVHVDVRVIAATKVSLEKSVREGAFREDLFYRLNVVPIHLPPLRERADDIPLLVAHFCRRFGGERVFEIRPEVLEAMTRYAWPGNVRELENSIERAIALAGNATFLKKEHLIHHTGDVRTSVTPSETLCSLKEAVIDAERVHIGRILRAVKGHKAHAARILGISRKNLWEKIRDYSIEDES